MVFGHVAGCEEEAALGFFAVSGDGILDGQPVGGCEELVFEEKRAVEPGLVAVLWQELGAGVMKQKRAASVHRKIFKLIFDIFGDMAAIEQCEIKFSGSGEIVNRAHLVKGDIAAIPAQIAN